MDKEAELLDTDVAKLKARLAEAKQSRKEEEAQLMNEMVPALPKDFDIINAMAAGSAKKSFETTKADVDLVGKMVRRRCSSCIHCMHSPCSLPPSFSQPAFRRHVRSPGLSPSKKTSSCNRWWLAQKRPPPMPSRGGWWRDRQSNRVNRSWPAERLPGVENPSARWRERRPSYLLLPHMTVYVKQQMRKCNCTYCNRIVV
jgi:hypothetical protein